MQFFRLSDGRVVVTNDLWFSTSEEDFVSAVPEGSLIAQKLSTRICQPKSREALATLLGLLDSAERRYDRPGFDPRWTTKSGLSDAEAYRLSKEFSHGQLPEGTCRTYRDPTVYASYASPENVGLTHVKIGRRDLQPFTGPEQLEGVDPSASETSVLFLYMNITSRRSDVILEVGDTIDESYVYNFPE